MRGGLFRGRPDVAADKEVRVVVEFLFLLSVSTLLVAIAAERKAERLRKDWDGIPWGFLDMWWPELYGILFAVLVIVLGAAIKA